MSMLQFVTTLNDVDIYAYPIATAATRQKDGSYKYEALHNTPAGSDQGVPITLGTPTDEGSSQDVVFLFNETYYLLPVTAETGDMYAALVTANSSGAFDLAAHEGMGSIDPTFREKNLPSDTTLAEQLEAAKKAKADRDAASKKKAPPLSAIPVDLRSDSTTAVYDDGDDSSFKPNWYLATAPAVGMAAGCSGAAATAGAPLVAGIFGNAIAAATVGGVLLAPAIAGTAAYMLTYITARLQYIAQYGTQKPGPNALETIRKNSLNNGQQLAAAFFGADIIGRQILERSAEGIIAEFIKQDASTFLLDSLGKCSDKIPGLGLVEVKGALMLFTGLGLAIGLVSMLAYQNNRDEQPHDISKYVAAFFIGFAIGAAASIGYGNEVAKVLMPVATTAGLLMLLPATEAATGATGNALEKLGNSAALHVGGLYQMLNQRPAASTTFTASSNNPHRLI